MHAWQCFLFFFFLLTCSRTTPWAHSIWKSNELVVAQILFSSFFFFFGSCALFHFCCSAVASCCCFDRCAYLRHLHLFLFFFYLSASLCLNIDTCVSYRQKRQKKKKKTNSTVKSRWTFRKKKKKMSICLQWRKVWFSCQNSRQERCCALFFFLNPRCLSFLVKQKTKTVRTLVFSLARSVSSLFPLLFLHVKCVLKYVLSSFLIVATPLCYPLYICIHLCLCVIVLPLLVQTISLPEKVKRREVRGSLHLLVTH